MTGVTKLAMDLDKPQYSDTVIDHILARYPKLTVLPRWGWRNKKERKRLEIAKRFLLDKDKHSYLVDEGSWAYCLTNPGARTVHAFKLLDQEKRFER